MYVSTVVFKSAPIASLKEAGPLFRTVVGILHPLSHSLLGKKPGCEEQLGLDLNTHQEVRKFKDEKGLLAFCKYLDEVLKKAPEGEPAAKIKAVLDGEGAVKSLLYATANDRARILLRRSAEGTWYISGTAVFKYPEPVLRALRAHGLQAVARKAVWKDAA